MHVTGDVLNIEGEGFVSISDDLFGMTPNFYFTKYMQN